MCKLIKRFENYENFIKFDELFLKSFTHFYFSDQTVL